MIVGLVLTDCHSRITHTRSVNESTPTPHCISEWHMDTELWLRRSGAPLQPLNGSKIWLGEKTYGSQVEIQAYWKDLSRKYGHIIFNTKVLSDEWDILPFRTLSLELSQWRTRRSWYRQLASLRYLNTPLVQQVSRTTRENCSNRDLDLRGKRVAVIGNGCSAYVTYIRFDESVEYQSRFGMQHSVHTYHMAPRTRLSNWLNFVGHQAWVVTTCAGQELSK